ncbi:MAG: aspartate aminotransferase family protein [Proteobacteria bacterium]|nr:aspartate aminotransferase family protein [Pseudomonadota bacterium]
MSALWRPYAVPGVPASLRLAQGEGAYVTDSAGRRYLNAVGGLWNLSLGLGNDKIIERVCQQMRNMAYASLFDSTHTPAELLAERLISLSAGSMKFVYLSTSGTSAVEVALRVARLHHRANGHSSKQRILSFDRSYHGCSAMNLSASGIVRGDVEKWDEILPGFQLIPSPLDESSSLECLSRLLREDAGEIACLIMEPILGSGGIIVPSPEYCQTVTKLCRNADVLLIVDEVATGGGRCGSMFASNLLSLEPDIITLSKGLNSGYFPVGATLFSASTCLPIQRANIPIQFGSTQDGNPVGCATVLAALDIVAEEGLLDRVETLGHRIRSELTALAGERGAISVRGMGLMIGIELSHEYPDKRLFTELETQQVRMRCQEEGLLVYSFDSGISLFPPLTISDDEVEEMLEILRDVISGYIA